MEHRIVSITEVCSEVFAGGDAPKDRMSRELTEEYQIPIYSNGEENDGLYGYTNFARVTKPSVTISARGTIGYASIRTEPFVPIVRLITVTPIQEIIDIRYLYYAVKNYNFSGSGTSIPQLTVPMLRNYHFPLPSLEEQQKIAAVLDKVTDLIHKRRQQLDKLDELVKSRFVEMFNFDFCEWESFETCTDFIDYRGKTPELSEKGTIRMINAKSVGKGYFRYVEEYVTDEVYNSWMRRGLGESGDVLFVTEGHTFGNTCLVPSELCKFALGQRVITIRGRKGIMVNSFLCAYMQTDRFYKDISAYRTGGTAQGIRSKDLAKIRIPLVDIELQNQFADFVEQIDKQKQTVKKSLDELETLKKSLLQRYFG